MVGSHARRGQSTEKWVESPVRRGEKKERQEAQLSIPRKDLTCLNLAPLSSGCDLGSRV